MLKSKLMIPWLALCAAAGLCAFAIALPAQEIAPPPDGGPSEEGGGAYETLARGPMHEAFANPYAADPEPGVIIEEQPPEPIDEVAPDQMPEGDNVVWIPGYWGWDPEANQFIWISGLWRSVPGESRWVPGYWAQVAEGYQWVAGFWTNEDVQEIAYLPSPPATLEQGPNIAPPDGDFFWVPGCWTWQTSDYQWRPGYWAPAVVDWIWIPDQYVWTPYGCVFVPGRWDFDVIHRGVMFAPIVFQEPVYRQPNFRYTPTVVINSAPLLLHLFVSPGYSHYYYGNYYDYQPDNFAFYPWYAYGQRRNVYDPMLTYYQWSYAQRNVNLIQRLSSWNGYFVQNQRFRPPRTFTAQRQFAQQFDGSDAPVQLAALTLASSLSNVTSGDNQPFAFTQVAEPQRQRIAERSQSLRQFQRQRSEFELAEGGGGAARTPGEPQRGRNEAGQNAATAPPERKLKLPEVTAVAQTEATPPGQAEAAGERDQPGRARGERRRPPAAPTPDPSNAGQAESNEREPGSNAPGQNRPGREQPAAPGQDRPGAETPADAQPGANRPGRGRPGAGAAEEGPEIPRFGVSRSRQQNPDAALDAGPGTDAARPDAPNADAAPDASQRPRGAARGRGGFDPFDSRPPGAAGDEAAPGTTPRTPGAGAGPPRGRRPEVSPGATTPERGAGRTRPNLPEGAPALPGRGDAARPDRRNAARPDRGGNPATPGAAARPTPGQAPSAGPPASAQPRPNPEGGAPPQAAPGGGGGRPQAAPGGGGRPQAAPGGGGGRPQAAPGGGGGRPQAAPGGGGGKPAAAPGGGGGKPAAAPGGGPPQPKGPEKDKKPKV